LRIVRLGSHMTSFIPERAQSPTVATPLAVIGGNLNIQ
jgi:hypothetical protein